MDEERLSSGSLSEPTELSGRVVNFSKPVDERRKSTRSNDSEDGNDTFQTILARTRLNFNDKHDPKARFNFVFAATAKSRDIWMMGLVIVLGGQMYGWNIALSAGFGTYFTAQCIIGIAYVVLVCCLAEIASAVAFSGGSYGLGRVVLGFYPGFIIGCLEMFEYTMMTSSSLTYISSVLVDTDFLDWDSNYQPIIWLFILLVCTCLCLMNRNRMWNFGMLLAMYCLILILIYCLGSLPNVSFSKYAPLYMNDETDTYSIYNSTMTNNTLSRELSSSSSANNMKLWFVGGMTGFMGIVPYCTWAFAGVEALTLLTSETATPTKTIPVGMIAAVLTLFSTNVFLVFVASSLPPGLSDTQSADFVMNAGLHYIFKCSDMVSSTLILPGQFAMAWGFVLPFSKLIHAMAQSNLMPSILRLGNTTTYVPSMIVGCLLCFFFSGLGLAVPDFANAMQNIAILAACVTYVAQLFCYYMLCTKFSSVSRDFRSPVGIPGAVFAGLAFTLCFIATGFFQDDDYVALYSLVIIVAVCTAYYYLCARSTQVFSKHEHGTVFRLHVINYNARKQRRNHNRSYIVSLQHTIAFVPSIKHAFVSRMNSNRSLNSNILEGKSIPIRSMKVVSWQDDGNRMKSKLSANNSLLSEAEISGKVRVVPIQDSVNV